MYVYIYIYIYIYPMVPVRQNLIVICYSRVSCARNRQAYIMFILPNKIIFILSYLYLFITLFDLCTFFLCFF